ncbi:ANKL1 protein, partial [Steatornis caripensis]|nr:ANKL1 protein [Steatornis caripensis]
SARELPPLPVTASWGCCGCLELLPKKGRDPQGGKRAVDLALEQGNRVPVRILRDSPPPGGPRRSLSFLTEDGTEGSVVSSGCPEDSSGAGPLSSTRRSLLEEPELGGGCGLGEPWLWPGCPPEPPLLAIPSLAPWPHTDPRGSALPAQPLASSTLLSAGDELRAGPSSQPAGGRTRGPPGALPKPVLLVDHGPPQGPPSDAQGSPDSSPTVLLLPGDHGPPQDPPSDARGSPCAARSPDPRVPEGGSGWQEPLPLAHEPPWPPRAFSHLLAMRPPGSTAVELGSPAVLLLPAGYSTHCSEEHLEDEERGQPPTEWHSPGTEATTSPKDTMVQDRRACTAPPRPLSDEGLRRRLRALGDDPGPSPELAAALRTGRVPNCAQDELALALQFDRPDRSRRWRGGLVKSSFNYLLLDPRTTQNLPLRSHRLSPAECFRTFVKAIFYVGKGTRARPYCHLAEALSQHRAGTQKGCPKVRRILEIWASGQGVISVHCFQGTVPAEAYTREGCLVEALGLQTITNQRKGNCYGVAASWPAERRRRLGVHMLHRAMRIFVAEGERQLRPADIQGRR